MQYTEPGRPRPPFQLRSWRLSLTGVLLAVALLQLPGVSRAMDPNSRDALLDLYQTDRPYRVELDLRGQTPPTDGKLFGDITGDLHPSYDATYEICQEFDPYNSSDSEVPRQRVLEYLETMADTAPILEAFFVTGKDRVEDLADAWFGSGRGFEHTICGEGSRGKLGGFHFWYLMYRYERDGRGVYLGADYGGGNQQAGMSDERIVTGQMSWDPDGPGGERPLTKRPRGGFTVGHSVMVMLAAGHIAFHGVDPSRVPAEFWREGGDDVHIQARFPMNLNGKTYDWTYYENGGSIRTLWPRWVPDRVGR